MVLHGNLEGRVLGTKIFISANRLVSNISDRKGELKADKGVSHNNQRLKDKNLISVLGRKVSCIWSHRKENKGTNKVANLIS